MGDMGSVTADAVRALRGLVDERIMEMQAAQNLGA
jgi:hypothetical protein